MSIGVNPACTVKASQMAKSADRIFQMKALSGEARSKREAARTDDPSTKAKDNAKRLQRLKDVAEQGELPCPMRAVLAAAMAGDNDAVARAGSLYGARWKELAIRLRVR